MGCYLVYGKDGSLQTGRSCVDHMQDSFYKPLTPEESKRAFQNEYDFDAPEAIDFDVLVDRLRDIKEG